MDYFTRFVYRTSKVTTHIGGGILLGLMVLIVANVVYRRFGGVIAGTYELVELLIIPVIGFSFAYAAIEKAHVVVRILVSRLSKRMQVIAESFAVLLGIGVWGVIAWGTASFFSRGSLLDRTEVLGIPRQPFRFVWVFSLVLFALILVIDFYRTLSQARKK